MKAREPGVGKGKVTEPPSNSPLVIAPFPCTSVALPVRGIGGFAAGPSALVFRRMKVNAFTPLVPAPGLAARVSSVPYDVVSTAEARVLAEGNPDSLLHVIRAEIDLPDDTDPYSEVVYSLARDGFRRLQSEERLVREAGPSIYLYRQEMGAHVQTGVALTCHIDDYEQNIIKKHEKTRKVKEDDRVALVKSIQAHPGPVFLTYHDVEAVDAFVAEWTAAHEPQADFLDPSGVRHVVWRVAEADAAPVLESLRAVAVSYVADGHHRSASAWRVGSERRANNPAHTGDEAYNWFLAVLFPASQLRILPYNRLVRDLNFYTVDSFLEKLAGAGIVVSNGLKEPVASATFCVYVGGKWHSLSLPLPESTNPIDRLDASILQDLVLTPILGIGDPRTDERIDFVGGIRGTAELEKRVDSGEFAVAFSLYPVTIQQLIDIADADEIMPPKSTWFEPKLRSGLFIHTID